MKESTMGGLKRKQYMMKKTTLPNVELPKQITISNFNKDLRTTLSSIPTATATNDSKQGK